MAFQAPDESFSLNSSFRGPFSLDKHYSPLIGLSPSPPGTPLTGEDRTPDSNVPGIYPISDELEAGGQLDSLDHWLVKNPDFSRGSVCMGDMKSFSPAFPLYPSPPPANAMNLPQMSPSRSLLFNSRPPSPLPSSSPATSKLAYSGWWDDPLFKGAYPSESLLLTYKLHSSNFSPGNFSDVEDSDTSYSFDSLSDSSSLLLSSSVSSNSDCSRNDSPAVIRANVENMDGASIAIDGDNIQNQGLHSPVPTSDAPLESSSPCRHCRTSSRRKMRASPYPKSPRTAEVRRQSAGIPDNVNCSNIIRKTSWSPRQIHSDEEHGPATIGKSIPEDTAGSFSPSCPSPKTHSTKRIPCTHPGCNRTFSRKYNLSKHIHRAAIHNSQSDSDSICPRCGVSLSRKDSLQRHQRHGACGKRKTSRKAAFLPLQVS